MTEFVSSVFLAFSIFSHLHFVSGNRFELGGNRSFLRFIGQSLATVCFFFCPFLFWQIIVTAMSVNVKLSGDMWRTTWMSSVIAEIPTSNLYGHEFCPNWSVS